MLSTPRSRAPWSTGSRLARASRLERAAHELRRDHQRERGEHELQRPARHCVCYRDAADHPKQAEAAEYEAVTDPHVPVAVLAVGAERRHEHDGEERRRLGSHLCLIEEDHEGGDEEDPAPHADEPPEHPAQKAQRSGGHVLHQRMNCTAVATRSAANSRATKRSGMRCWTAAPATTPASAGMPTTAASPGLTFP